jgi:hypothetical protein
MLGPVMKDSAAPIQFAKQLIEGQMKTPQHIAAIEDVAVGEMKAPCFSILSGAESCGNDENLRMPFWQDSDLWP